MPEAISTVQTNVDLSPYNTLQVAAKARKFVQVTSSEQLVTLLRTIDTKLPVFVLGGGSNVLFIDDFDGLVIQMAITGKEVVRKDDTHVWLKIGAGENWHKTVRYCVEKGWGGIENLSLIPGTVGAAPIQNIGAYGVELEEVFDSLTAIMLETGEERIFKKKDCRFGYRDSVFKQGLKGKLVVTDVTLKLSKNPVINTSYGAIRQKIKDKKLASPTIKDVSDVVIEIRNSKLPDPATLANAGSFFKNPVIDDSLFHQLQKKYPNVPGYPMDENQTKVPAGWLIEQAGWKGRKVGPVGTYRQQALVIVNHGGATGGQIWALAQKIRHSVEENFDITLAPEVNVVGTNE